MEISSISDKIEANVSTERQCHTIKRSCSFISNSYGISSNIFRL